MKVHKANGGTGGLAPSYKTYFIWTTQSQDSVWQHNYIEVEGRGRRTRSKDEVEDKVMDKIEDEVEDEIKDMFAGRSPSRALPPDTLV